MAEGVRITGLNATVRSLERLGVEVDDLKEAFAAISREAAEKAARYAPKRTGKLSRSVRGNRSKNKATVSAGGKAVPYAAVQNYGWPRRNITASRYMQRADEDMRPIAVQRIDDEIGYAIRKAGLR